MGNILVTGGAGYIGSHVNKELSKKGFSTIVFDNLTNGHRELVKWGDFILADLKDINQIRLVFKRYDIDAVMHFAAHAYVGESVLDPQKYYQNNVANTLNLLSVMHEANVKKIIFSSTCATYGIPKEIPITEKSLQNPVNPYGWSKLMIERILFDYADAYNLKYCSLRYFNAAGADPDGDIGEWHIPETHLIPLVLDAALGLREEIKIYGTDYSTKDGTCIRDYIHVKDLAHAHLLALEYLLDGGESNVFNLGNANGYSVKEVIKSVERVTKKHINVIESDRRPGDPPVLVGSMEKAKEILGWYPIYKKVDEIILTSYLWKKTLKGKL